LTPASQRVASDNPIISLFVAKMRLSIPAGSFEEKRVNNRICFAKYLTEDKIGVVCI